MSKSEELFSLAGKIVLVTGAGRGNGMAIANALASVGAEVWGIDKAFSFISDGKFRQIVGDITDAELIHSVAVELETQDMDLVLINNAGVTYSSSGHYPLEKWELTLKVNLTGPFMWIEAIAPLMSKRRTGSIINITSLGAERGFPDNPAYIASKGGLKMLTKAYAKTLGSFNVRANNLGPGYIVSDMTRLSYNDPKLYEARRQQTLLGRWGESADLIGACIFLASDASAYVTGQDLYVDGGWTANGLVT